jgi:hypothetical protein
MPLRLRRSVAVICLAVAFASAFAPAVAIDPAFALLTPVWQYEPPASIVALPERQTQSDEQTASLLRFVFSRPPPPQHLA